MNDIPKGPKHLTVFATNKCNFKCQFCRRTYGELDTTKDIDIKTVKYALNKYPSIRGTCMPPGEEIYTYNGVKYIEDISIDDEVLTHKGNIKKVTHLFKNNYTGDLIGLKVQGKVTYFTPTHKIPIVKINHCRSKFDKCLPLCDRACDKDDTYYSYKIQWKMAKDINIRTDYLLKYIDTKVNDMSYMNISRYNNILRKDKFSYKLPENIKIGGRFLMIAGYYLSEGSIDDGRVSFTFNINEFSKYVLPLQNSIFKLLNLKGKVTFDKEHHTCVLRVNSKAFANFMEDLFHKGAKNKNIPNFIMKLPPSKQLFLIRALWQGDGHLRGSRKFGMKNIMDNGRGTYVSISPSLIHSLQMIMFRNNIITKMKVVPAKGIHKRAYYLNVNGDSMDFFRKLMSKKSGIYLGVPKLRRKLERYFNIDNKSYLFLKINDKSIKSYNGYIYNFEVEDDHSYHTLMFTVKNCIAGFGEPLLYSRLEELVKMLRNRKLCVRISTNGSLVIAKKEMLKRLDVYEYSVSMNSDSPEAHANIHGVNQMQYPKVIQALHFIRNELPAHLNLTFVCNRTNYMKIPAYIRCFAWVADSIHFFNQLPHTVAHRNLVILAQDKKIIQDIKSYKKLDTTGKVRTWPVPIDPQNYKCGSCVAPNYHMLLGPDGHISGCIRMRPPNKDTGSIFDIDPWNNQVYKNLRNQQARDIVCKFCLGHYMDQSKV